MSTILKISEAAILGLHAMIMIADNIDRMVSTREIATAFNASETHLSKVMQRLVKAGYLKSVRGPGGGFVLIRKPEDINLMEIYELFEGALSVNGCMFQTPLCSSENCVFGGLLDNINNIITGYLKSTDLKQASAKIRSKEV